MPYRNQWPTNRLLSTAARLVEHAWNENLASLGITHAGVMALDVLHSEGSMTQAQLAHQVRVQAQTMGKTLHRLEVHGHITRSKNEQDRRSHGAVLLSSTRCSPQLGVFPNVAGSTGRLYRGSPSRTSR